MPMPDWGSWLPEKIPMPDYFFPAFWYIHMIFQYHIAGILPWAAVYELSTTWSLDVHCVSLSPPPAVWTCRVYPVAKPAVWTCRANPCPPASAWKCKVCPFPQPTEWTSRVYTFPQPAVWSCRVSSLPPPAVCIRAGGSISTASTQQYGCAGCIFPSTTSSMHTCRGYHFPPASAWKCKVCPFPQPTEWTSRVYQFPQPAVRTCRGYQFPPTSGYTSRVCPFPQPAVWACSVQGVCLSTTMQQYGRAGCVPFYHQQYWRAGCTPFLNAGMLDCPASSHSGTGMNKNATAGTTPVPE